MSGDARGVWISRIWGSRANSFEQLTIDNSVGGVGLTRAKYVKSNKAFITIETAPIRFRVDGGAPTATIGHFVDPGDQIELESTEDIANFRAIRTGSTSATLNVSYSN